MTKGIAYILIYFFIYKNLAFYPSPYCSYFNIFSTICCFLNLKNITYYKKLKKLIFPILGMIFIFILSIIVNNKSFFISNPLKNFIFRLFLDINFIVFINGYLDVSIEKKYIYFFKGVIYSTSIDIILGLLRFKFKVLDSFFLKIFPPRDNIIGEILAQKVRLMGVGGYFFSGGINLGISLILISFLLTNTKMKKKEKIKLKIIYYFNFILGILISRTTILGFILSLYYFFKERKNNVCLILRIVIHILVILSIIWIVYSNLDVNIRNNIHKFLYFQGIGSMKRLIEMYKVLPENWKTVLLGDSLWENQDKSYYMNIDIGYIRMIFFNGILGLFFKLLFNYKLTCVKDKKFKKLSSIMFLLFLLLNLKGDILYLSISLYIYIFYLLYNNIERDSK